MIYAGIGSRETPEPVLCLMWVIGASLARKKWTLRSGRAKGADKAFEYGCDIENGLKEIFTKDTATPEALELAEKFHPAWHNCNDMARKLHARNGFIVMGKDLNTPVQAVLAYAPGGFEWGGTSQALRIARHYEIPILNMFDQKIFNNLRKQYGQFQEGTTEI